MRTLLTIIFLLVMAVVATALVAGPGLRNALSRFKPERQGLEVRVELAREASLVETVAAPGDVEPHTSVEIAAEVSARIVQLPVKEGQEVRRGDLICKLDDKGLRAALVSSEARRDAERYRLQSEQARLGGLQQNLEFAQRELERIRTLHESGDVSARDLDSALERVDDLETSIETSKFAISVVEAALAGAEADIEQAQDGLDNTTIESPMDGMVTLLNVEIGEVVTGSATNPGTVLMTIADLSRMIHKAEVAESDITKVEIGQQAKLYLNAYAEEVFSGTVRHIAWQRSEKLDGTGFFKAEIEIDTQGRKLRSGLKANAEVEVHTHEGVVIPYQAIVAVDVEQLPQEMQDSPLVDSSRRKTSVVYRVVDGVAKCTPVKPGASDLTHRIVREGIQADELIVVGPLNVLNDTIKDGQFLTFEAPQAEAPGLAVPHDPHDPHDPDDPDDPDDPGDSQDQQQAMPATPSAAQATAGTPSP